MTIHDDAIRDIWGAYLALTDFSSTLPSRHAAIEELADIIADDLNLREATALILLGDCDPRYDHGEHARHADADKAVIHSNLLYGRAEQVRDYLLNTGDEFLLRLQRTYCRLERKPLSEHDLDMIEEEARELCGISERDVA